MQLKPIWLCSSDLSHQVLPIELLLIQCFCTILRKNSGNPQTRCFINKEKHLFFSVNRFRDATCPCFVSHHWIFFYNSRHYFSFSWDIWNLWESRYHTSFPKCQMSLKQIIIEKWWTVQYVQWVYTEGSAFLFTITKARAKVL